MKRSISVILLPLILLCSCSNDGHVPLSEFQKEVDKLDELYYSTATMDLFVYEEKNGKDELTRESHYEFHYDSQSNQWLLDEDYGRINPSFLPQTLKQMDIGAIMDRNYEYTFYINPFVVKMFREIDDETQKGYRTWTWNYDETGYLNNVTSYDYNRIAIIPTITKTNRVYTYR